MKMISKATYVYCGILIAGATFLCTYFFNEGEINRTESITERKMNGIYMAGETVDTISGGNLVMTEVETDAINQAAIITTTTTTLDETTIQQPILPIEEYEALCRIVQAEAGNQDAEGKLLIANVVLNRVKHEHFPDTIQEVIFQDDGGKTQFAPTKNGSYQKVQITIDTMAAVNRALAGEDISMGALYFKAGSATHWGSHDFLFQHGDHVFFL
ncbi:MAG TPA: cell wall hydrolase [Lachnospiraceae bacterium]|nr:cell wall hydrolase [Lachnospiraceae bacterium]